MRTTIDARTATGRRRVVLSLGVLACLAASMLWRVYLRGPRHSLGAAWPPDSSITVLSPTTSASVPARIVQTAPPAPALQRNPFIVKPTEFPLDRPGDLQTGSRRNFPQPDAKSPPAPADLWESRQVFEQNLRQQANQIRLQSTVMSASPQAIVNGETVQEGDVVASFRVLRIEARRIIVERDGIRLDIPMN